MKTNKKGIDLIKKFEGLKLKPYLCSAGVPTIGYGSTFYEDGTKVKLTDAPITLLRAESLLKITLSKFEKQVNFLNLEINGNQFSALVSFSYNLGIGNLNASTLLKKVRKNPEDATIRNEFAKWNKAGGKVLAGLVTRRKEEADLYFTK